MQNTGTPSPHKRRKTTKKEDLGPGVSKRDKEFLNSKGRKTAEKEDSVEAAVNTHLADGPIGREMVEREQAIDAVNDMELADGAIDRHMIERKNDT